MTIVEKHKAFCKKYNKDITYNCYYTKRWEWYTDKEMGLMTFTRWSNRKDSIMAQHRRWKNETWRTNCYEWFKRRKEKWISLDYNYYEHTMKNDWRQYIKTHDHISYSKYIDLYWDKEDMTIKRSETKETKLDLTNVDIGEDYYYTTL